MYPSYKGRRLPVSIDGPGFLEICCTCPHLAWLPGAVGLQLAFPCPPQGHSRRGMEADSVPAQRDLLLVSALSGALSRSLPTAQPRPPQSHRPPGCWQCPPHWSRDTTSRRRTELIRQLTSSAPILLSRLLSRCPNPHAPCILSGFLGLFGKNRRGSTVSIPSSHHGWLQKFWKRFLACFEITSFP